MKYLVVLAIVLIAGAAKLALWLGRDTPEERWQRDQDRETRKWRPE